MTLRIFTLLCVGLLLACGGASAPAGGATGDGSSSGDDRQPALVVQNSGDRPICAVYFSPSNFDTWGPNQLATAETIDPGATRGFYMPAGSYDVKLEDCRQAVLLDRRGVAVVGDGVLLSYQ
jgi:hypothetical protein